MSFFGIQPFPLKNLCIKQKILSVEFVDGQLLRTKEPLIIFTKTLHHRCLTGSFEYTSEADKALTHKN